MYSECVISRYTYILRSFDLETHRKSIVYIHYTITILHAQYKVQ